MGVICNESNQVTESMAQNFRGQLGVKSSPLAPTSSKLTTQMLVVSHMQNHYNKINKAKPAIDNGIPKSMLSSQKMRDKHMKKLIERYGSRPVSRLMYQQEIADDDIYNEKLWDEPETEEERQVHEIMRSTLRGPLKGQHHMGSADATAGSKTESTNIGTTTLRPRSVALNEVAQAMRSVSRMSHTRPASARSITSLASNTSRASHSGNHLKVTYDGDVLDKFSHAFTESKPFTPRTLKSNRESSLKKCKHYTPPPRKIKEKEPVTVDTKAKEVPQAKPRRKFSKGGGDMGATEDLTETMLMNMSLQSHEARQPLDGSSVPRLDITMDKDHMNWVQEQATRAQIRSQNGARIHTQDNQHLDGGDTIEQTQHPGNIDTLRFTHSGSSLKSLGVYSPTSLRLGWLDKDQKYVAFAHEVTKDILNRGIISDRILNMVFENHVERKKDELDERRLRAIITDIRRDLNVKPDEPVVRRKSLLHTEDMEGTKTSKEEMTSDSLLSVSPTLAATNTYSFAHDLNKKPAERITRRKSLLHTEDMEEAKRSKDETTPDNNSTLSATKISNFLQDQHVEPVELAVRKKSLLHSEDMEGTMMRKEETTSDTMMSDKPTSSGSNSYNFDHTTELLSTIHSPQSDEAALTASQSLQQQQYLMSLAAQETSDEQSSVVSGGLEHKLISENNVPISPSAKGNDREAGSVSESIPDALLTTMPQSDSSRARWRRKQDASLEEKQEASVEEKQSVIHQASIADTDARTEDEGEEEKEYDTDEDDGHESYTQKLSDEEF